MSQTPRYTNVKVNISNNQKIKIKQAISNGTGVNIRLLHDKLEGDDILALTQSQINKIAKAFQSGKGVTIKMSKTQVEHNMKVEGGFLPILAGLASSILPALTGTVLPALATGALSGVASNLIGKLFNTQNAASGSGLYIKKGGACCKVQELGSGLYLKPYRGDGLKSLGEGLYIKTGNGFIDGSGLILGEKSPFKNIPLLGWIL